MSSSPTGISPSRPQTSRPSRKICRRWSRPWTHLASNGSPWAPFRSTKSSCAAPPKSNTYSWTGHKTPCPHWSPVGDTLPAINTHFWDWIWWLTTKASIGRTDLVAKHMPKLYTQLLEPMGISAVPPTIESAIEAFEVAPQRTGARVWRIGGQSAREEVRQGIARVLEQR